MDEQDIETRREKLRQYRISYYNLKPLVPDDVYDAEKEALAKILPNDPEVRAIGATPPKHSVWEKVRHEFPMGSLDKAQTPEQMFAWMQKMETAGTDSFFMTQKIDGSSMELVYEFGKLVRCVTRGDGHIGEDVTFNISKVPSVPKSISFLGPCTIRGEIVMFKATFDELYREKYANPRNTAAAKVREKDGQGEDCRNLHFIAYWMMNESRPKTQEAMLQWLQTNKFEIPTDTISGSRTAITEAFERARNSRESIPYGIDGMVVSVQSLELLDELGENNLIPNGQMAWKFSHPSGITKVDDIRWQVGPTGRITPVLEIEPLQIDGVTIVNVSLHNLSIFRDLKLRKGDRVLITRRNDVIPYCERNLSLVEREAEATHILES